MRILIAGGSGFLGSHLTTELRSRGHDVVRLVRRPATEAGEEQWDPYADRLDQASVEAADVVINLAGSPTAGNPHSRRWAEALEKSRVTTTRLLAERIAAADRPPTFVAGNAVGWYGDHGDELLTENAESRGSTFMTEVSRHWQDATQPVVDAGGRLVILRTAPVLDRTSAPLKQMLPAFRLGLGVRLGSGDQYFAVISLRDWLAAAAYLVEDPAASGPYNLCCPVTPTNAEFTDALARAVGRRARLTVPAFVIEKAAGRMAPELLGSLRTEPAALLAAGFTFRDDDVDAVLRAALG